MNRTGQQVPTSLTLIVKARHIHSEPENTSKDNENMGSYTKKDFKDVERTEVKVYVHVSFILTLEKGQII